MICGDLPSQNSCPSVFSCQADAVARQQVQKIPLGIAAERGFAEMRIGRQEIVRPRMQVGEIAAPAARDADFLARGLGVVNHQNTRPGMGGAHHAGGPGTQDQRVDLHNPAPCTIKRAGSSFRVVIAHWPDFPRLAGTSSDRSIPMNALQSGAEFPQQQVPQLDGGTLTLGAPRNGRDWQMVIVYRGRHCPLCKKYLTALEHLLPRFHDNGIDVVIVSGDPEAKARAMADDLSLSMPVGYDLSVAQMRALGVYVSDPRSPQETDRPFPEPGLFVINEAGNLHLLDISNAPFSRPDLEALAGGLEFIRANNYPIRGTHLG